jgi:transposase
MPLQRLEPYAPKGARTVLRGQQRSNALLLPDRDIRPFCTGRSSWLFSDTVAGAKASAMIYSLMLTCRACNVEPYAHLLHVLTELPQRPPDADITDLLPFNFSTPTP